MNKKRWVIVRKGADFAGIAKKFHITPMTARIIRNREIVGEEAIDAYLNGTIADLNDGMLMKDMDKALEVLIEKIQSGARIRVIGDYDIDGVCATYILLEALGRLGADADSDIPDRVKDGYGLNMNLIRRAAADEIDTIITCDNGIAAANEIAYAKSLGMTVIVTDHHEVPYKEVEGERVYNLPPADAVVDPKRRDCAYPFKELCGAAVAYKMMECLYEVMGEEVSDLDDLLEEVGMATVGDVMDLVGENRIFTRQALEMLSHTKNLGLKALIEKKELGEESITAYDIGFILGPCLNAGGRMDTAKRALALLQAKTRQEAGRLADDLTVLNESRKEITLAAAEEACRQVEETSLKGDDVLVIYLPDCAESIAGIVAGRVREAYYKPVFILTDGKDHVKGSGRSIEAYHMYEALTGCSEYLLKFGGHKQAAGLSIDPDNIDAFRRAINEQCRLTSEELTEKVSIDMVLPFSVITKEFVRELSVLEPFGKGNRKPVFAVRNARLLSAWRIGKEKNMLKMILSDESGVSMPAVLFMDADEFLQTVTNRFGADSCRNLLKGWAKDIFMSFTFYPEINDYTGEDVVQITITNYQ